MKRFYKEAVTVETGDGWQVALDGRRVKTVGGRLQVVPARALAEALAAEWAAQGEDIDAGTFVLRDLADYALDVVAPDPAGAIADLLPYGDTDTLLYRAEPGEALARRQHAEWEPLLVATEARLRVSFHRVSGIVHRHQPEATLARLREALESQDVFALAALRTLAGLSASLTVALAALEPGADADALFRLAHLEEEWQAEMWGRDAEAETRQARRASAFTAAARFAALARTA